MSRVATSAGLATIALIVLLGARPVSRETIVAGYAILLAAIGLAALTSLLRESQATTPSRFEAELAREREAPSRPADLIRTERELVLASSDGRHFQRRLRPLLEEIAAARGVDDDFDVESPSLRDLAAMVDRLEAS
ncbi:MAG: hypothetical protein ABUS54_07060 [Actinomycetota bacterium]